MLVVTPFHPGDAGQALTLFRWIRELGGAKGHSLILVADSRCAETTVAEIRDAAGESFDSVEVLRFVDHFQQWPEAPNAVFAFAARHIMAGPREPWFFMEPDCAPLKPGWLDAIAAEYKTAGKPFMGARVEVDNVPLHMSGNGVYPVDMYRYAGVALIAGDIAWDVAAASQIVPQAHFTKSIEHAWKHGPFESWEQVEREVSKEAILYHASKDGSLIRLLRENLQKQRANEASAQPSVTPTTPGQRISGGPAPRERTAAIEPDNREERGAISPVGVSARPSGYVCDILIKSYPKDYEWLSYCLRAIAKFATGFRRLVILYPDGAPMPPFDATMGYSMPIVTQTVVESGEGYLMQQACKANAHEYTDADFILHLDSDCILTRQITPETFMRNGKPLWLMSPYSKIDVPWQAITEKFIGQPIEYEFMRRLPALIPRSLYVAAARFCEVKHGMRLTDYILRQPHRAFSEFNALGALAWLRARDEFEWLDTHTEEVAA